MLRKTLFVMLEDVQAFVLAVAAALVVVGLFLLPGTALYLLVGTGASSWGGTALGFGLPFWMVAFMLACWVRASYLQAKDAG